MFKWLSKCSSYIHLTGTIATRNYNANRCLISRIRQAKYTQVYPCMLTYKDGSTITIRYHEPRKIIKLPLLLTDAKTETERLAWLARRRKREKLRQRDDSADVNYDSLKYIKFIKRK